MNCCEDGVHCGCYDEDYACCYCGEYDVPEEVNKTEDKDNDNGNSVLPRG